MSWNYRNYVKEQLTLIIRSDIKYDGLKVEVSDEQAFTKKKDYTSNTIYVVIKELSSSFEYNAKTTPIQILVVSEENRIDYTKEILNIFATNLNWNANTFDGTYVKQQYNSPVVLSNFGDIASGYRSVLYLTGTLFLMEGIFDIREVKVGVNGGTKEAIQPLNIQLNYAMSGNTQQVNNEALATTVKNTATLSLSMTIPFINKNFITTIYNIMNGLTSGNTTFNFEFKKDNTATITYQNMKLVSANIITATNQISGLQLGFMK